jgi:cobalt-zinc-cadmium efflux system outer membrane protein
MIPPQPAIAAPEAAPVTEAPAYGSLALPTVAEDEGPPHGLTLDIAIERMVHDNLDLASKYLEIPQAEADVLTASLRANPVFYADGQLIPYGQYSPSRPGGQLQYDINISYPLDITHKRQARILSARRAKRVLEAQYQDAVRQQIDNLYTLYVNVLDARQRVRYADASRIGTNEVWEQTQKLLTIGKEVPQADVDRVRIMREKAEIGLHDANATLLKSKQALASMLNIPPGEAGSLEVRGTVYDHSPLPPTGDDLIRIAIESRPDLIAFRMGIERAQADVTLAKRNRLQDVYVLYQPYTFQNNQPFGLKSATSWALGVTVPLPIYNRNQGVIQRAQHNVTQTRSEMSALERQLITDVQQAEKEYLVTREAVAHIDKDILPIARRVLAQARLLYRSGEASVIQFLDAQREYNETAEQYLVTVVRHRRAMLDLNTAVGKRILP